VSYKSLLTEIEPTIEVWSWGSGSSGQLGLDHLAAVIQSSNALLSSSAKQLEPRRVSPFISPFLSFDPFPIFDVLTGCQKINSLNDKFIIDVIADDVTSAAISRDGKVYIWGHNSSELLISCSTQAIPSPILIDFVPIESEETTIFSSRIQKVFLPPSHSLDSAVLTISTPPFLSFVFHL